MIHRFCLAVWQKLSYGADLIFPLQVGTDHRRTLRHAVSLKNGDAKLLKETDTVRIEVSASAADGLKLSAEYGRCSLFLWNRPIDLF